MTSEGPVLVTGATGNQGGAVARHLLRGGGQVRALVRNLRTPAAQALQDIGVTLARGDMSDADSLHRAMDGVHGVFSVQALAYEPDTLAEEIKQGKTVADVARRVGVR